MLTKIKIYSIISILLTVLFLFVGCNGSSTATNGLDGNGGKDGKNGTSWYSGEGSPAEKDLSAALGDFYLDTATCDIYVLNESGWSFSVNIKGNDAEGANPDNSNGTSVGKGSEFITGEGEPVSNLGNNGDLYIDLKSKDVWYKKNEIWTVIGNMGGKISKQNWNDDGALKILFIGNSYTYYNDMPLLLEALCRENGKDVTVTSVTKGARRLMYYQNEDPTTLQLRAALAEGSYDVCFLQEQSVLPAAEPQRFYDGVRLVEQMTRDSVGKYVFYSTWGRKKGHSVLECPF